MNFLGTARGCFCFISLVLAWFSTVDAGAVTLDQAKAQCHDKFVPVVRDCVRRKVSQAGGSPATYIAMCRESIMPGGARLRCQGFDFGRSSRSGNRRTAILG